MEHGIIPLFLPLSIVAALTCGTSAFLPNPPQCLLPSSTKHSSSNASASRCDSCTQQSVRAARHTMLFAATIPFFYLDRHSYGGCNRHALRPRRERTAYD